MTVKLQEHDLLTTKWALKRSPFRIKNHLKCHSEDLEVRNTKQTSFFCYANLWFIVIKMVKSDLSSLFKKTN